MSVARVAAFVTLVATAWLTLCAPGVRPARGDEAAPASLRFDPPAGTFPYFPRSPFRTTIPVPPPVSPSSAAWIANASALGAFALNDLRAYYTSAPDANELAFPLYLDHAGAGRPVTIRCTADFGGAAHPCNIEGLTVFIDPRMVPQNGGNPPGGHLDAHWTLIDPAGGYEYDTWQTQWPPEHGVLTVGWGGRCALDGNGFTNPSYDGPGWNAGCTSNASGTPLSLAAVRAEDLLLAARTHGSLPHALAFAYGCTGLAHQLAAPFLSGGDGRCAGAVPEGTRLYLALHDAQVDALGSPPLVAALLRTLDEDHYGGFVIDSEDGPKPGFDIAVESDRAETAGGGSGAWLTGIVPEARREGLVVYDSPVRDRAGIRLVLPPAITWSVVRFW